MARPVVAIVGRPNVGKSTLFNKLVGARLSIVDDKPGVTRDRIYGDCEWLGHRFLLVDTGGIEPRADDVILSQMRAQANIAIATADVIVLVTDLRSGVVATDQDVANMLQKSGKPVILCVNKCDSVGAPDPEFYEFYNLGMGDPIAVSAVHGHGTGDLLDAVIAYFPPESEEEEEDDTIKVAVIGKPNVGKSSLINRISGQERANVCVIMIDATEGFTEQDSKVAGIALDQGKGCIVVVNKWDAVEKDGNTMREYKEKLAVDFAFMKFAPFVFISAKTGQRVDRLFEQIAYVYAQSTMRISTGKLNEILGAATARVQPPTDKGKRLKIYYMTQASVCPPTFVFFVNNAQLFHFSYQRYLENQIREVFGLEGTPVRFIIRERGEGKK